MDSTGAFKRAAIAASTLACLATTGLSAARLIAPVAQFSATLVDTNRINAVAAATPISITIERWSTDAERDRLTTVLNEQGADKLLEVLQKMPEIGRIAATGSVGTGIHFARAVQSSHGQQRVSILTDRRVSFWETAAMTRSSDYPFTMIELRIGSDGKGEGKASLAAKIIADKDAKTVTLENFEATPASLIGVTRVGK